MTTAFPKLLGRNPSNKDNGRMVWRGKGWRVEVEPSNGGWKWLLCIFHAGRAVVESKSIAEHPTEHAAIRSVSAVIRAVGRAAADAEGQSR